MMRRFAALALLLVLLQWMEGTNAFSSSWYRTLQTTSTHSSDNNIIRFTTLKSRSPTSMQHHPSQSSSSLSLMLLSDAADPATTSNFWQNTDVWIFVAGVFPFAWATVEFWRRIMFGEPFGTGSDSVIIGMDDAPQDSRGRRVLGKGALITAYVLFVVAFGTLGIVLYSVVSSAPPPTEFLSTSTSPMS